MDYNHAQWTHVGETKQTSAVARPFKIRSSKKVTVVCVRTTTMLHLTLSRSVMKMGTVPACVKRVNQARHHEDIEVTDDDGEYGGFVRTCLLLINMGYVFGGSLLILFRTSFNFYL